jgi:hypothetical protein
MSLFAPSPNLGRFIRLRHQQPAPDAVKEAGFLDLTHSVGQCIGIAGNYYASAWRVEPGKRDEFMRVGTENDHPKWIGGLKSFGYATHFVFAEVRDVAC